MTATDAGRSRGSRDRFGGAALVIGGHTSPWRNPAAFDGRRIPTRPDRLSLPGSVGPCRQSDRACLTCSAGADRRTPARADCGRSQACPVRSVGLIFRFRSGFDVCLDERFQDGQFAIGCPCFVVEFHELIFDTIDVFEISSWAVSLSDLAPSIFLSRDVLTPSISCPVSATLCLSSLELLQRPGFPLLRSPFRPTIQE